MPALGPWLLGYGSHTDKCTTWQLTAGRRQNTYKKQTQKLLNDSRLGPWASPVILSVAFLSNRKLTSKNRAAVHPLFSMTSFCSRNTWRKGGGEFLLVPSVFSVLVHDGLLWLVKMRMITDQGKAQQSATLLTKLRCFPQEASFKLLFWGALLLSMAQVYLFSHALPQDRGMCARKSTATPWGWWVYPWVRAEATMTPGFRGQAFGKCCLTSKATFFPTGGNSWQLAFLDGNVSGWHEALDCPGTRFKDIHIQ